MNRTQVIWPKKSSISKKKVIISYLQNRVEIAMHNNFNNNNNNPIMFENIRNLDRSWKIEAQKVNALNHKQN